MSRPFFVYDRFARYLPTGERVRSVRSARLEVVRGCVTKGAVGGGEYARLWFSDGTSTEWMPINRSRPSYGARCALAYRRFCYYHGGE